MVDITLQIKAISKSNAQLLRLPVNQFVIGQSFDTVFEISNIGGIGSPEVNMAIEVRMDPYDYTFPFWVPELAGGVTFITTEIKWDILNQGICTFSFARIDSVSPKIVFVDKNKIPIPLGQIFHKVVSTTPEGVYEYWAMIISAIGLSILAFDKLLFLFEKLSTLLFNLSQ